MTPGMVIEVEEPDYLFGTGPLRLRVTAVHGTHLFRDYLWLRVDAVVLGVDGRELRTGQYSIRVDAARAA